MHSPQPFPWGSAPVAVQSRPVSNRTYSAEIPRLSRCRHSSSAATSRIIAYQKRSHARISVPYTAPICKPFLPDFPDFFRFFLAPPHLVPRAPPSPPHRGKMGPYYYYIEALRIKFVVTCRRGTHFAGRKACSPRKSSPTIRQGSFSSLFTPPAAPRSQQSR